MNDTPPDGLGKRIPPEYKDELTRPDDQDEPPPIGAVSDPPPEHPEPIDGNGVDYHALADQNYAIKIALHESDAKVHDLTEENRKLRNQLDRAKSRNQQPGRSADPSKPSLDFMTTDMFNANSIEWIIPYWLPRGAVSLLAGPAGAGKSTLAIHMASLVTNGGMWPGQTSAVDQGKVLLYSREDDLERTTIPRLIASGARRDLVSIPVADNDHADFFIAEHVSWLIGHISDEYRLVIIDPAMDVVVNAKDEHRAGDIRKALAPLQKMAQECNVAVLCLTHFLKRHNSSGSGPLDRVMGSQAWGAVARMVLAVDLVGEERVLMRAKSNLGPIKDGWAYDIEPWEQENLVSTRFRFTNPVEGHPDNVFRRIVDTDDGASANVRQWMEDYTASLTGPVGWDEICAEAKRDCGFTANQVRYAAGRIKDKLVFRRSGFGPDITSLWGRPEMFDD